MKSKSSLYQNDISLKTAGLAGLAIASVVALAMGGALLANRQRREQVVRTYTDETLQLLSSKQDQVKNLFTQVFDECARQLETNKAIALQKNGNAYVYDIECATARTALSELGVSGLKDSSAIAYLRVKDGQYEVLEASGKFNGRQDLNSNSYGRQLTYRQKQKDAIHSYLIDKKPIPMWDDYIQYIPGKEVIVPVKIDGVDAYIFRGVLER